MPSSTASPALDQQLQCLVAGFDALQDEYQRLWIRCQTLDSSLETVKTQYTGLTSQCPHKAEPLLLPDASLDAITIADSGNALALSAIPDLSQREKIITACRMSQQMRTSARTVPNGIVLHSGPSADKVSAPNSSAMPSITESPLEQDFTVAGTPSRLDCPFASMTNRRLSSHAASIVSRYRPGTSTPKSSVSRVNGRASSVARASITDPIKAETCGMASPNHAQDMEASGQGSTGVCPIRFLDQHSPEEVAAYFESHKHELPRSHEVCVKRYQSNEESIKELDAKYGNLVSMIQGLGQKHVSMLPDTPGDGDEDIEEDDHLSAEKIRKWASSVGTDAAEDTPQTDNPDDEERQQRFDRPLKDVRLGESPSRPWGIQVPLYINRHDSYASSMPAMATGLVTNDRPLDTNVQAEKPHGKCPFGFDSAEQERNIEPAAPTPASAPAPAPINTSTPTPGKCPFGHGAGGPKPNIEAPTQKPAPEPTPIATPASASASAPEANANVKTTFWTPPHMGNESGNPKTAPQMVFNGPVFIGYSLEDAMKLLQASVGAGASVGKQQNNGSPL